MIDRSVFSFNIIDAQYSFPNIVEFLSEQNICGNKYLKFFVFLFQIMLPAIFVGRNIAIAVVVGRRRSRDFECATHAKYPSVL